MFDTGFGEWNWTPNPVGPPRRKDSFQSHKTIPRIKHAIRWLHSLQLVTPLLWEQGNTTKVVTKIIILQYISLFLHNRYIDYGKLTMGDNAAKKKRARKP